MKAYHTVFKQSLARKIISIAPHLFVERKINYRVSGPQILWVYHFKNTKEFQEILGELTREE